MGRHHHHAAAPPVAGDSLFQGGYGLTIQCHRGLIEKPQIGGGSQHTGQRQPPFLARREHARGKIGKMIEAESVQGVADESRRRRLTHAQPGPERKVLAHRHGRLQPVEMAYVMLAGMVAFGVIRHRIAVPQKVAAAGFQQSRHDPQQARLATAVRTQQHQRIPGFQREIKPLENRAATAHADETAPGKQAPAVVRRSVGTGGFRGFRGVAGRGFGVVHRCRALPVVNTY